MISSTASFLILKRASIAFLVLVLSLWLICFLCFFSSIPLINSTGQSKTDAIIVLTGGVKRLAAGFDLLVAGRSNLLFVSGVNTSVKLPDIQKISQDQGIVLDKKHIQCCVELGYAAFNTRGNAIESAEWITKNRIRSIFLVTSNYHIDRSLLEFRLKMPNLKIHKYPVVSNNVMLKEWWRHPSSMRLLITEYHKFMYTAAKFFLYKLFYKQ
mgnify:FL=1